MPMQRSGGRPGNKKRRPSPPKSPPSSRPGSRTRTPGRDQPAQASQPSAGGGRPSAGGGGGRLWLYGRHAVEAALLNPRRTCHRLLATDEALERLDAQARAEAPEIQRVERADLDARLGEHTVHQGLALAVAPLPQLSLEKACAVEPTESENDTEPRDAGGAATATVLVLDRVNDPHNLGAILRSAVAFGVRAVILPHRQSAELGGATAKAASGALDMIPIVEVANLSRALDQLKDLGYWRAGLDGCGAQTLDEAPRFEKLALVLGAEGSGIRRLVAEHCDLLLRLPISERMESLNVSVACGIALYGLTGR
ncbi:MAG: 23S rRNA (guanosine(2251)-2'-O)-methyltransferase RlmB [Alphaproteobacteria bacterium]